MLPHLVRCVSAALIVKKRFLAIHPLRCLRHIHRLCFGLFYIPIAVAHRPGNAHVGQAQHLVFLRIVIRLAITVLTQARHAVHLVLVRRARDMLAITKQKYRISLQAFGTVIGQLL